MAEEEGTILDQGSDAPSEAAPSTADWRSGMSEDLRDAPSLKKFDNAEGGPVAALAKAYTNLEPKIAEKGLILPKEGSSLTEIRDAFSAMGCPTAPGEYELSNVNLPDQINDQGLLEDMKQGFWDAGVSEAQTSQVMNAFIERNNRRVQEVMDEGFAAKARAEAELQQEWGNGYSQRLNDAEAAAQWLYGDAVSALKDMTFMDGSMLGNNVLWVRGLAKMGEALRQEGSLPDGKPQGALSIDQAQAKLVDLNSDPELREALRRNDHPRHEEVVNLRRTLYEVIHGDTTPSGQNLVVSGDQTISS